MIFIPIDTLPPVLNFTTPSTFDTVIFFKTTVMSDPAEVPSMFIGVAVTIGAYLNPE